VSPSQSVATAVYDVCKNNECAANSTCVAPDDGDRYACDCSAMKVRAVGRLCNVTLGSKPTSVWGGNCPGCASAFICTNYTGDDPRGYMQDVKVELAASYCSCKEPPKWLVHQFGGVQFVERGASELCMEFTIYSGNPNTTAKDIVRTLETNPPPGFTVQTKRKDDMELCADADRGCILDDGDDDSLLYIVIGVSCVVLMLLLGIAWYVIHKRIRRQWSTRRDNMVAGDTLTIKSTWLQGENENVSTFKSCTDTTGLQNNDNVAVCHDDHLGPAPAIERTSGGDREKLRAAAVGRSASADSHNSSPALPGLAASFNGLVEINIPPRGRGSYITPMGRIAKASRNASMFLPPMMASGRH
jgi:hypothetical protein